MNRIVAREEAAEKLSDVHEIKVTAYGCQTCSMIKENKKDISHCAQNGHNVYTLKATKRFFECKQCGKRVRTLNQKRVIFPCPKCKGSALNFKRAGLKDSGKFRPAKVDLACHITVNTVLIFAQDVILMDVFELSEDV